MRRTKPTCVKTLVLTSETHKSVHVTVHSDQVLGLDKLRTKPAGEVVLEEEEAEVGEHGSRGDFDAEVGLCGTKGSVAHGGWADRDRRHWSGDQCHPEKCRLAEEDTGRDSWARRRMGRSRSKTLVGGAVAPGGEVTCDRRHWWGHEWHTGGRSDEFRATSFMETLVGAPVAHGRRPARRVEDARGLRRFWIFDS